MGPLLYTSPFLVALVGIALGYYFKRFVLVVVTVLATIFHFGPAIAMLLEPTHSLADVIPLVLIAQGLTLLVPMWITHFVKCLGGVTSCLNWLKNAIIDTEKK